VCFFVGNGMVSSKRRMLLKTTVRSITMILTSETSIEITKEELKKLPRDYFQGEVVLVETTKDAVKAAAILAHEGVIGVDTETKPSFKKGQRNTACLLQLASKDICFLFRIHKFSLPQEILDIFSDETIIKSGVAVFDDFKELQKIYKFTPRSVVDLNILAPKYGFKSIGAQKLTGILLGFYLSKKQQVSNWEAVSLSDGQKRYAASDAWIGREIYLKMIQMDRIQKN